jgi:hypothetical protein
MILADIGLEGGVLYGILYCLAYMVATLEVAFCAGLICIPILIGIAVLFKIGWLR